MKQILEEILGVENTFEPDYIEALLDAKNINLADERENERTLRQAVGTVRTLTRALELLTEAGHVDRGKVEQTLRLAHDLK